MPGSNDSRSDLQFAHLRCRSTLSLRAAIDLERPHLSIQIRALNAEGSRRVADAAVVLLENRRDVFLLEPRRAPASACRRSVNRPAPPSSRTCARTSSSAMPRPPCMPVTTASSSAPELGRVAAPRQRRKQRQRRARQRLGRHAQRRRRSREGNSWRARGCPRAGFAAAACRCGCTDSRRNRSSRTRPSCTAVSNARIDAGHRPHVEAGRSRRSRRRSLRDRAAAARAAPGRASAPRRCSAGRGCRRAPRAGGLAADPLEPFRARRRCWPRAGAPNSSASSSSPSHAAQSTATNAPSAECCSV